MMEEDIVIDQLKEHIYGLVAELKLATSPIYTVNLLHELESSSASLRYALHDTVRTEKLARTLYETDPTRDVDWFQLPESARVQLRAHATSLIAHYDVLEKIND